MSDINNYLDKFVLDDQELLVRDKEASDLLGDSDISELGDGTVTGALTALNSNLTQLNTNLTQLICVEDKVADMPSVSSKQASSDLTIDLTKSGYVPIMVTPTATGNNDWLVFTRCQITSTNTATVKVFNNASSVITTKVRITVLYLKNI